MGSHLEKQLAKALAPFATFAQSSLYSGPRRIIEHAVHELSHCAVMGIPYDPIYGLPMRISEAFGRIRDPYEADASETAALAVELVAMRLIGVPISLAASKRLIHIATLQMKRPPPALEVEKSVNRMLGDANVTRHAHEVQDVVNRLAAKVKPEAPFKSRSAS